MKRKKPPVVLIAFLVVLLGTALGINLVQSGAFTPKEGDSAADRVVEKTEESPESLKAKMKEKISPVAAIPTEDTLKAQERARRNGVKPPKPAVAVDRPQKYVPKPSDTQTGSGWYSDEGRK